MDSLSKLGKKYGTDKIGKHNYLPVYYDLFKDRTNEIKKVLEIGVGEGAGLRMWRDFFPKAVVYGAEIDLHRVTALMDEDRIHVHPCDQSKEADLNDFVRLTGKDLDLVVDDGSHKPEDQVFTALYFLPLLKEGAIYVIEDVADLNILAEFEEYVAMIKQCGKRYDDRLIIIQK